MKFEPTYVSWGRSFDPRFPGEDKEERRGEVPPGRWMFR